MGSVGKYEDKMTMMNLKRIAGALLLLAGLAGCSSRPANKPSEANMDVSAGAVFTDQIVPQYAAGFEVRYERGLALVDIVEPGSL